MSKSIEREPAVGLTDADLLARWRGDELRRRQLDAQDAETTAEIERRGLAAVNGCKSTVDFARHVLRIGAREATARTVAATKLATRRAVTGQQFEPMYPTVSAALADGAITRGTALTIVKTVEKLPEDVRDNADTPVADVLLGFARDHDPDQLARHARDLRNALDQDGAYRELNYRDRVREVTFRRRVDGSGRLEGDVTCELGEYLETLFGALSAPKPAEDGTRDPRTPGQRRHDALLDGLRLLLKSGRMPDTNGCATTVVLTMSVEDFATNQGTARTNYGVTIPVDVAKSWLDPETRAILVLLSKTKGIEAYSSIQRLFTEQQRLAMAARDRGCSYWGCTSPPAWSQAHHVTDFKDTKHTRVDDGALVCHANHATFEAMGWKSVMLSGLPHWVPPTWLDPEQTPVRNHMHDA